MYEPLLDLQPAHGRSSCRGSPRAISSPATTAAWRFQIRRGVTWSDGRPFTARDVAFTFELLKKFPALDLRNFWQYLAEVRVTGDDARRVPLRAPVRPRARGHLLAADRALSCMEGSWPIP
jgi:peptide/nickel transport system substrate-binding protein